ncbi:MAG: hypothetical protein CMP10_14310 [Zetaproteobacteria bacterium]|nr:hypothetical protein [Pseudobdellovibrionaceae bacterium]
MLRLLFLFPLVAMLVPSFAWSHGISEEARKAMIDGGYLQYIWLGAEHMITGYDHLLFLFGVIFFLTKPSEIVKFVTAFTVGHSITLIVATFMKITANYFLVDAVIAVTVCYKGFDNNGGFQSYLGLKKSPNLVFMVFVFGLIHGFGLSTRLQQLPLGEDQTGILFRILSFNLGVELGQIAALMVMLLLLARLRAVAMFSRFSRFSKVANDCLILAGFLLMLSQLHGYQHDVYSDDFGLNEDEHTHIHEDWDEEDANQEYKHDSL